jgi:alpha-1,3-mannosyl-glycoprotein beta-1,2-N-acetylglucosaminyltransferase
VLCCRREGGPKCPAADCHISQHYKLLLQLFFQCHKAPGLLFVEEDLEVAPDFFTYFEATTPLMERDSSIYCVSAWNDHGQRGRVKDNTALYRTDVMPGLGWYLNSKIGLELAPKWPLTNWDDWMRLAGIKNGRSCIYPEVRCVCVCGGGGTMQFLDVVLLLSRIIFTLLVLLLVLLSWCEWRFCCITD